uniref:Myb/SANT-like domain-containing protein n=2 Tax=Rhizophora mucronata TaxID=61149 RepID=A0A2P2IPS4_RHIMU
MFVVLFQTLWLQIGEMVNKSKKNNFKWTDGMDDAFIDALLHQQRLGFRVDNVFTTAAYDNMVKELREKIGMPFLKDHLKNRLKTLKNNFKECFDLFNDVNGFTWSPETKIWTADPEAWKAYVKAKPDAKKWMTTQIAHYDKLLLLFSKDKEHSNGVSTAKAKAGRLASSRSGLWFGINNLEDEPRLNLEDLNEMNDGVSQLTAPVEANSWEDSQARSQSVTSLRGKKRKTQQPDSYDRQFRSIKEAIKDVAEAIREGNLVAERGRPRVYTEQEVFEELAKIGVESNLKYKAYTFLISNASKVRAFFGCPAEERKEFLMQLMFGFRDS